MRKHKICRDLFVSENVLVVEPNNALTPREILQQFGQGFTSAYKEPTDEICDDSHSDDELVDKVITFEDEFEAMEMMSQPMYPINDDSNIETSEPQQSGELSFEQGGEQPSGDFK